MTLFRFLRQRTLTACVIAIQVAQLYAQTNASSQQNPFLGGVPAEKATSQILSLTLRDALARGLKYNLGLLLSEQGTRAARAQQLSALSALLPNVNAHVTEDVQQINLAALGLPVNALPGLSPIVGPFSVFDARGTVSQHAFDWSTIQNYRASKQGTKAAQFSYKDARETVVQVVTGLYLQSIAGQARVDAAQAQLSTAKAIYDQTVHQKEAGMAAGIDVLRSQVEMQALEQRVLSSRNDLEKQKLALARAIGLPDEQQFSIAEDALYAATPVPTLEEARQVALQKRPDYQQAISLVKASELARKSASAEHLPSLQFDGDYGIVGPTPGNSHGTFTSAATLAIPIFQGGRVKADVLRSDAQLRQSQAQADDLRGRINQELRNALMDLNTSAQQVDVARSSVELANRQLVQSRDRFRSGVANTIEVVQAQESVANANESLIASVHAYNLAKASLARAMGVAETDVVSWLKGGQ